MKVNDNDIINFRPVYTAADFGYGTDKNGTGAKKEELGSDKILSVNAFPCQFLSAPYQIFTHVRTTYIGSRSTGKFGTGTANTSTARVKLSVYMVIRAEPRTFVSAFPFFFQRYPVKRMKLLVLYH